MIHADNLDTGNTIPFSLDFEGQHYTGRITPSNELGKNKKPVYFRVTLGGEFYAYLCCGDRGWRDRDNERHPPGLVQAIGDFIADFYE